MKTIKAIFIKIFGFVLDRFETGEGAYAYKKSSRVILLVVGLLFLGLSGGSLFFSMAKGDASAFLPIIVFFAVAGVCLIVGLLGSDRAVATLWGNANKHKK
ncbi:MAG: hypothetical protein ACI934_002103 [Pseudohongiellaceae bacterium]